MKKKRIGKRIAALGLCMTTILAGINMPGASYEVYAESLEASVKTSIKDMLENAVINGKQKLDVSSYKINAKDESIFSDCLNELRDEGHMELLGYAGTGYDHDYENNVTNLYIAYDKEVLNADGTVNLDAVHFMKVIYDHQLDNLFAGIDDDMSDIEKVFYVQNWLVKNITYGSVLDKNGNATEATGTAKGAIVNGTVKCAGYAITFDLIMDKLGIECVRPASNSMNHEWNQVKINDEWYNVDVTWADYKKGGICYNYFLKSDDEYENNSFGSSYVSTTHQEWDYPWGDEEKECSDSGSFSNYIFRKYGNDQCLYSPDVYYYNMEYYDGYWYFTDGNTIKKSKIDGTGESVIYEDEDNIKTLYLYDGYMYYMKNSDVYRFPVGRMNEAISPELYLEVNDSSVEWFAFEKNEISLCNASEESVVTKLVENDEVRFKNNIVRIDVGDEIDLEWTGTADSVSFVTSDSSVLSVSDAGKITANKGGVAKVVIYTKDYYDICSVEVNAVNGDLDADGDMDSDDLKMMLRYLAGYSVFPVEKALDVNADKKVDIKDYVELAKIINGDSIAEAPGASDVELKLWRASDDDLAINEEFNVYLNVPKNTGLSGISSNIEYDITVLTLTSMEYIDDIFSEELGYPDMSDEIKALEQPKKAYYPYWTINKHAQGSVKFYAGSNEVLASTGKLVKLTFEAAANQYDFRNGQTVTTIDSKTNTTICLKNVIAYDGKKIVDIKTSDLTVAIDPEKSSHKHSGEWKIIKEIEATCTQPMKFVEQQKCNECNEYFGSQRETVFGSTGLGHDFSAKVESEKYLVPGADDTYYYSCSREGCGESEGDMTHTFETVYDESLPKENMVYSVDEEAFLISDYGQLRMFLKICEGELKLKRGRSYTVTTTEGTEYDGDLSNKAIFEKDITMEDGHIELKAGTMEIDMNQHDFVVGAVASDATLGNVFSLYNNVVLKMKNGGFKRNGEGFVLSMFRGYEGNPLVELVNCNHKINIQVADLYRGSIHIDGCDIDVSDNATASVISSHATYASEIIIKNSNLKSDKAIALQNCANDTVIENTTIESQNNRALYNCSGEYSICIKNSSILGYTKNTSYVDNDFKAAIIAAGPVTIAAGSVIKGKNVAAAIGGNLIISDSTLQACSVGQTRSSSGSQAYSCGLVFFGDSNDKVAISDSVFLSNDNIHALGGICSSKDSNYNLDSINRENSKPIKEFLAENQHFHRNVATDDYTIDGNVCIFSVDHEYVDGVCEKMVKAFCSHKNQEGSTFVDGKCRLCNYECDHANGTVVVSDKNGATHSEYCSVCDGLIRSDIDCSGGNATCTEKAICSYCNEEYGSPAQHKYSTTWTTDGNNHWHKCTVCGNKSNSAAHSLKTTTTKKATLTANGKKETKCSVCAKLTKTTTIYAATTVKLSTTKCYYDGKVKKPSVIVKDSKGNTITSANYTVTYPSGRKNVGKYTIKVTFKGDYSGSKSLSFTINPPKTAISSLTAGKKSFTAKWAKKTTQVSGYEIQYSTSSTFAKGNVTVKITTANASSKQISKLLAGKKYYVRIRTYKTVGSTKYYSEWSAKKAVTTKK